jgi:hypothetical protein
VQNAGGLGVGIWQGGCAPLTSVWWTCHHVPPKLSARVRVLSDLQSNDTPQEVVDKIRNSSKDTFNSADEVLQTVQRKP